MINSDGDDNNDTLNSDDDDDNDNLNSGGDENNDGSNGDDNELVSRGAFFQTACVLDEALTYNFSLVYYWPG